MESNANSIFENIFRQCFVNINIYWLTCSPLHINCIWAYNKNYYRRHLTGHFVSKQIRLVSIGTKSLSGIASQQFLILLFSYFSRALVFPTFKNVIENWRNSLRSHSSNWRNGMCSYSLNCRNVQVHYKYLLSSENPKVKEAWIKINLNQ